MAEPIFLVIIEGHFVNADGEFDGQVELQNGVITRIGPNLGTPNHSFAKNLLIFAVPRHYLGCHRFMKYSGHG
jgi:hypothetical protein